MRKTIIRFLTCMMAVILMMGCLPASAESSYIGPDYEEWAFIRTIPMKDRYTADVEHHGTVEKLRYTTHSYALEAVAAGNVLSASDDNSEILPINKEKLCGDQTEFILEKELLVYLPYGYDPNEKYNVVYALHGTGEDETYWIGDCSTGNGTRKVLDRMIDRYECDPFILVSPTYYSIPEDKTELFADLAAGDMLADVWPMYFWMEMRNDIIPLIDSTYSTYGLEEDARAHRGFVGLSRGSMTTLNSIMMHCLDQFAYFGNYSGLWCDFDTFKATMESDEYKDLDVKFWYNGNGSADFALDSHEQFRDLCLKEMPDRFRDDDNYAWISFPGGRHAFNCWLPHLYNTMLVFFTK